MCKMESHAYKDHTREFIAEPIPRLIWRHTAPAVASMLVMALYQIADGAMVGRRLGPDALAAVNILYPVLALFVGLAVMLGVGGSARIAVLLGSGNAKLARKVLSLLVLLGSLLGLTGTAIVLAWSGPLTSLLGADAEVQGLSLSYLLVLAPFFTAFILSFILEQAVRNDGRSTLAGAVMASGAVLNIALDYLFLYILDLGIAGAALASGISMSVCAVVFVGYFTLKTIALKPGLRLSRPILNLRVLRAIAVNGSSELFSSLAVGVVTLLFNRTLMHHAGSLGVAAFAMVQYLLMLGSVFFGGMATGAQPIISHNYGAGRTDRVSETLVRVMGTAGGIGIVLAAASWAAADRAATLFVPHHPEAISMTAMAMRIVAWSLLFAPVGTIASMYFTSIERAAASLGIAALRALLFPLAALAVLPGMWGETGIWLVPAVSEFSAALASGIMLIRWAVIQRRTGCDVCCPETASGISG